jgi:four helix bundle protein
MATIKRFEDIEAWQLARKFNRWLFSAFDASQLGSDYALRNQIDRSAGSIMDNIAEGFERSGNREFVQFLGIAKGSCGETRSQLYRVLDRAYIDETTFESQKAELETISSKISSLMNYLIKNDQRGWKFQEPDPTYNKIQNDNDLPNLEH